MKKLMICLLLLLLILSGCQKNPGAPKTSDVPETSTDDPGEKVTNIKKVRDFSGYRSEYLNVVKGSYDKAKLSDPDYSATITANMGNRGELSFEYDSNVIINGGISAYYLNLSYRNTASDCIPEGVDLQLLTDVVNVVAKKAITTTEIEEFLGSKGKKYDSNEPGENLMREKGDPEKSNLFGLSQQDDGSFTFTVEGPMTKGKELYKSLETVKGIIDKYGQASWTLSYSYRELWSTTISKEVSLCVDLISTDNREIIDFAADSYRFDVYYENELGNEKNQLKNLNTTVIINVVDFFNKQRSKTRSFDEDLLKEFLADKTGKYDDADYYADDDEFDEDGIYKVYRNVNGSGTSLNYTFSMGWKDYYETFGYYELSLDEQP